MRRIWLLLFALPAFGQLTMDQKVFDFQALAGLYAKHYAGHDWKLALFGFDSTNIAPWLDRVNAPTNDLDFYELMVEYVADLHDGPTPIIFRPPSARGSASAWIYTMAPC